MPNPYSPTLIAHFRSPRNHGSMRDPTITQEGANPLCGDRVRIELRVADDAVQDARFTANACAICVASASMLTDLVRNAPLDEVETLTLDDLIKSLKAEIPAARVNCVRLPLTVMHTGVHQYRRARHTGGAPRVRERRVAAIVLAAGQARRFGAQKLLAPFGDSTVIRHVVERVLSLMAGPTLVVVGAGADAIRGALSGLEVHWAVNPDAGRGMSSSVAAGVEALAPDVEAAIVALGDQPTLSATVLSQLVDTWWNVGRPIVAPRYRGRRGNPVLFDRSLFDDLRMLEGDRGARDLIAAHPSQVATVEVDETTPIDIDTPADYELLLRMVRASPM